MLDLDLFAHSTSRCSYDKGKPHGSLHVDIADKADLHVFQKVFVKSYRCEIACKEIDYPVLSPLLSWQKGMREKSGAGIVMSIALGKWHGERGWENGRIEGEMEEDPR